MGGWKLEIFRMSIYMAFPVGIFHYFNQPQYFEEWVVKTRRELYPPETPEKREIIQNLINKMQKRREEEMLKALEEKEKC
ncbi:hypothetical protein O3M35_009054 [Rhynocoris fuscipes]|uniref:Protein PET100 homolog, mitochondrial n=1 Tax=Rhynocoris fuscipes TaxID=488301 RepID=A0AAW1D1I3_9HEMI